jgi:hypothetical protein
MLRRNLGEVLQVIYSKDFKDTPHPLPLAHVAPARLFENIIHEGELKPTKCAVFGDERLYLYYGGVYYRSSIAATRDEEKLPVAFLFDPSELSRATCCFPFDTGAIVADKFGTDWKNRLSPLSRFRVDPVWGNRTPSVLVKELYVNNQNYLSGTLDDSCAKKAQPLPLLYEFLSSDLSRYDADQRQTAIECHYAIPLKLTPQSGLLWVGYPNALQRFFTELCDFSFPSVPKPYAYTYRTPFRPSDLEAKLEAAARAEVERYLR